MDSRLTKTLMVALFAVLSLVAVSCGGGGDDEGATNGAAEEDAGGDVGAAGEDDAGGGGGGGGDLTVTAQDFSFSPNTLEVPSGEEVTVTFKNNGQAPHTFTSEALGFDTGSVSPGDSKTVTFTAESEAQFVCTIHAGMQGTIQPQ